MREASVADHSAQAEKVVTVVVQGGAGGEAGDGGIALVGAQTKADQVRKQIMDAHEGDEDDEEEEPNAKLLAAGKFAFVRPGSEGEVVDIEQEASVAATELGDPITVKLVE